MSIKAALKAAKSALDAGDYDTTIREAQNALSSDAQNYFARLFLGRAYEKQSKFEDAAKAYQAAADAKPDDSQAWLGLCSVYETQGAYKIDDYQEAAVKAAQIFANADDKHRCQSTIDKLVSLVKQKGTQSQYKRALEVLLPDGPIYEYLEGRIQSPSVTYTRLAEISEEEEAQTIKQEISSRRTRIGARIGQVTTDVKREVFERSQLENLYQQVINWSNDDEVRRQYEEKLLQRAYETLVNLPTEQKNAKLDQVLSLAEGMVIVHHPFELAWNLVLESRDLDDLRDLDVNILKEYITFFAETGLGSILRAWLTSALSPFPLPNKDEEEDKSLEPISAEDRLLLFTEGLRTCEGSPFAHRLVGDHYLHLEENESAVDVVRNGLKALAVEAGKLGMTMQNTKDALNSVLATALVHHQAPRNHPEAHRLFEDILQRKPRSTPALIGLGLIFEENEKYDKAIDFLSQALREDASNVRVGTELAWCRALAGEHAQAQEELEGYLPQLRTDDPRARDIRAQVLYRIGMCMWNTDSSKTARRDRKGAYSRFLAAIKTNVNFAPAYTALGNYYADYGKDKKRARQCFQKAFELSAAETDAAERLARSFADQGDWDIVEVIAQRIIDTGKARPPPGSKRKGLSWPYSALGVVQMNKQEYQQAITSFLAALRISPDDYSSYVGLGESYHNSGRYNSALRTFNYALEEHEGDGLRNTGDTWFAKYMLANVHRELGEFDEAIEGLEAVLAERSQEFGVLLSLLQTFVERGWRCVETGLFGKAVESAVDAIRIASNISATGRVDAFNLWKGVGDACSIFSCVASRLDQVSKTGIAEMLQGDVDDETPNQLTDVDQVSLSSIASAGESSSFFDINHLTLLAYKRAISSCLHDIHAQAVAWYNLGWAEHRAFACSPAKAGRKYLKAAVRAFKRAIELEAGNPEFWNALGIVTTTLNPKVSQHAFVRSLHINELNAKVWTNLGVLYLLQNDNELAHQAFGRAQSTDPDYGHAWVGEGLIALLQGQTKEALNHFTHAFEISDSSSLITKRQYTTSAFDNLVATPSASNDLTSLIQPIFALEQLHRQSPNDLPYNHLAALFYERVGNHTAAVESLTNLCSVAEADYEASESLASLARFAHAKADLARNQLAVQEFSSAAENAETALDLSSDADTSGLEPTLREKIRLSSHLTAGLAYHNLCKSSEAVSMFKTALQESDGDPDVVVSLVQVLYAHGGSEEKSVARDQLFEAVERNPEHVGAVTLLGAVAALDDDADTLSAVQDDLRALRTSDKVTPLEASTLSDLLFAIAALSPSDYDQGGDTALGEAQSAIVLSPADPGTWTRLAEISGEDYPAAMAVAMARQSVTPDGDMEAAGLAKAFKALGTMEDMQRAAVLAPWDGLG